MNTGMRKAAAPNSNTFNINNTNTSNNTLTQNNNNSGSKSPDSSKPAPQPAPKPAPAPEPAPSGPSMMAPSAADKRMSKVMRLKMRLTNLREKAMNARPGGMRKANIKEKLQLAKDKISDVRGKPRPMMMMRPMSAPMMATPAMMAMRPSPMKMRMIGKRPAMSRTMRRRRA